MAEFKMPKYKDDSMGLDECYRDLSKLSYESPIKIIHQGFETKLEGEVFKAILKYGVSVDKDELIKALQYDRNQYEKGFIDGYEGDIDAIKADTVQKMQSLIKERCIKGGIYPAFVAGVIDQIAKEMLEG